MEREKIITLMEGYAAGTLTPDEEQVFLQWYEETDLEEFNVILEQCENLPGRQGWYPEMPAYTKLRLDRDIRSMGAAGKSEAPIFFHRRYFLGWAAAILLIAGTGGYFLYEGRMKAAPLETVQLQAPAGDIHPGSTKAVLTLADGKKITLDSAGSGLVAQQGKASIVRTNGELKYMEDNPAGTVPEVVYNSLSTGRGEQSPSLILPDGTKVWLNAVSSIRFPVTFAGNDRAVEVAGEAYFEVAQVPGKPFHVKVDGMDVEVLGTHFNINAYEDEPGMATTVLEGSVKVVKGSTERVLLPGQQAEVRNNDVRVKDADVDRVMAWKNGLFNFDHADLQTVLRQLSRWYDVDIKFEGEQPSRTFHGKITRDLQLSQVLQLLQEVEVKFRIEGKTLVVTN